MPRLVELSENFKGLRDQFEVLAFHDPTAKDFADLDKKLAPVVAKRWGGKPLPFPILLDSTGATIKAYAIRAYPTTLLIDPEGKVVKGKGEDSLNKVLVELAGAASKKGVR